MIHGYNALNFLLKVPHIYNLWLIGLFLFAVNRLNVYFYISLLLLNLMQIVSQVSDQALN